MSVTTAWIAVAAIAAGAGLIVVGLATPRRSAALDALVAAPDARDATAREAALASGLPTRIGRAVAAWLSGLGQRVTTTERSARSAVRLAKAGISAPPEILLAARAIGLGVGVATGATAVVLTGQLLSIRGLAIVAAAAAIGALIPDATVLQRTQRRRQATDRELPETLDLLALTVQAGLGLEQALREVVDDVPGPLGEELDRMLREQQLGRSRRDTLTALRERTDSDDLANLAGALLHAEQLGTPLTSTLQTQARELRRHRRALARERAGKAPVKLLFPLIFGIFPAMFVIIIGPGIVTIADALLR